MIGSAIEPADSVDQTEAYKTLCNRVGHKSPAIPPDLLVRHVMECVPSHEWTARVDGMDALLRRLESVKRDELRIEAKPSSGKLLGIYATRRLKSGARPYETVLLGVSPIEGRCDCPDFLRNSLKICKHLLVVLVRIHSRPALLKTAMKEQERRAKAEPSGLEWDPIRPLVGAGDWLERVTLRANGSKRAKIQSWIAAEKWFRGGNNGTKVLSKSYCGNSEKRLALVDDLIKLISPGTPTALRDPALRALLLGERERLRQIVEATPGRAELRKLLKGLKRALYAYQRDGVERFLERGRLLLADDMGLGKTAQAISCTDILMRSGRIERGLIIAPASLKPQWSREWAVFSHLPIQVVDGGPEERQAFYDRTKRGLLIINYEQLLRDLDVIRAWKPDLVVLDEAQRIKNWATKTALSVKGLAPRYRLVLTGTPMENRIDELASVVEWVDDQALEPKWRLNALHSIRADGKEGVIGARNLDTIRARLAGCMVRRIRQDVLDQLPPRTDTRVPIEMTEEQIAEHDSLTLPIITLINRSKQRPLTQVEFLKLMSLLATQRVISNGIAQLRFLDVWPVISKCPPEENLIKGLSAPKLLELRQLVRQIVLEQSRKAVVFSQWRRMLTLAHWAVSDLLEEGGLRAGFFTGAEKQSRRTQNIVEFHDDPNHRILFTSDAGGVGLNLQRAANCVINLELPWNPAVLEQRIGRVYRLGQEKPIDVYNLVCEYGIESRISSVVGSKQAMFKGLFDSDSESVRFDQSSSFLARIEQMHAPEVRSAASAGDDDLDLSEVADVDDEVRDPFEPLLDAADESPDAPVAAAATLHTPASTPPTNGEDRQEPALGASVASNGTWSDSSTTGAIGDVRELLSKLEVRREPSGKLLIEAPPEAASTLLALFERMAVLLQSLSPASPSESTAASP
jgi:superfamily II DNA or RNA helicase